MRRGKMRWAVFAWEPDGDMGESAMIGPFESEQAAERKAAAIRRKHGEDSGNDLYTNHVDCIVIPVVPGGAGLKTIRDQIGYEVPS